MATEIPAAVGKRRRVSIATQFPSSSFSDGDHPDEISEKLSRSPITSLADSLEASKNLSKRQPHKSVVKTQETISEQFLMIFLSLLPLCG